MSVVEVETFSKPGVADVTPADAKKISPIVRHYAKMPHPFTACYRDQIKHGLESDHAKRRCAVVKMLGGRGSGGKSKITADDVEGIILTRTQLNEVAQDSHDRLTVIEEELGEGAVEQLLSEAVVDAKKRNSLPASDFVFPERKGYPIHDRKHGANALSRSKGKPEEGKVRSKVCSRYKDLPSCGKSKKAQEELAEAAKRVLREDLATEVMECFACIEAADRPRHRGDNWDKVAEAVLQEVGHPDTVELVEAEQHVGSYVRHSTRGNIIQVSQYSRMSPEQLLHDLQGLIGGLTSPGRPGPTELHGPEGVKVKAVTHGSGHRFHVTGGNPFPTAGRSKVGSGDTSITGTAGETAKELAQRSARSTNEKSIGGETSHRGLASYGKALDTPVVGKGAGTGKEVSVKQTHDESVLLKDAKRGDVVKLKNGNLAQVQSVTSDKAYVHDPGAGGGQVGSSISGEDFHTKKVNLLHRGGEPMKATDRASAKRRSQLPTGHSEDATMTRAYNTIDSLEKGKSSTMPNGTVIKRNSDGSITVTNTSGNDHHFAENARGDAVRLATASERVKTKRAERKQRREGGKRPDSELQAEVDRANAKANAGGLRAQQRDAQQRSKKSNGRKPSLPLPSERRKVDTRTTRRESNGSGGKGKTPKRNKPESTQTTYVHFGSGPRPEGAETHKIGGKHYTVAPHSSKPGHYRVSHSTGGGYASHPVQAKSHAEAAKKVAKRYG